MAEDSASIRLAPRTLWVRVILADMGGDARLRRDTRRRGDGAHVAR
jgi:hypothetical protein